MMRIIALLLVSSCALAEVPSPVVFLTGEKDVEERVKAHVDAIMEDAEDGTQIVVWQVRGPRSVSVYHGHWSPQWEKWTGKPTGPVMYILGKI